MRGIARAPEFRRTDRSYAMTTKKSKSRRPTVAVLKSICGRDGRMVQIPAGFVATQGRDGRMIAVPSGAGSLEGSDGRVVAIPPGHLGIENAKGRVVAKPRW